jgi:hypothetical protein
MQTFYKAASLLQVTMKPSITEFSSKLINQVSYSSSRAIRARERQASCVAALTASMNPMLDPPDF